jgi:hypothetical protein
MSNIWRANYLSIKIKLRIFNACIKSVLLYGCKNKYCYYNFSGICKRVPAQVYLQKTRRNVIFLWQRLPDIKNEERNTYHSEMFVI